MPVCADGVTDMFEKRDFNLTSISEKCVSDYGISPDADAAIREWGGRDLSAASNIIFSNGDRDPWSAGGVLHTIPNKSISVIVIPHACHHEDLRSPGPDDPPQLLQARKEEARIIAGWVKEFREKQRQSNEIHE